MGLLDNRRVIVTGAGQGLGRAVAQAVVDAGARVVATDLPGRSGVSDLAQRQQVTGVEADLASTSGIAAVAAVASEFLGTVNAVVSCHAFMAMGRFLDQDAGTWWKHLDVNVRSNYLLVQQVLPDMVKGGDGRIVFIGSEAGSVGMHEATGYSASKAALASMAKTMAREPGACWSGHQRHRAVLYRYPPASSRCCQRRCPGSRDQTTSSGIDSARPDCTTRGDRKVCGLSARALRRCHDRAGAQRQRRVLPGKGLTAVDH